MVTVIVIGYRAGRRSVGPENHSCTFAAVDGDCQRVVEPDNPEALRFVDGGHSVEVGDIVYAVVAVGVDGEVAHTERCEVVEEVSALARFYPVVVERRLNDQA